MKGWPDYVRTTGLVENYDEFAQNYPVGIGDGAARLGSIKTYDMRGRAIFLDDFEAAVLHWETTNLGAGGSQALDTTHVRNGNQSVKLVTNTGIAPASAISRKFPLPKRERIGIETSLTLENQADNFRIGIDLYDGTDHSLAMLQFRTGWQRIEYWSAARTWVNTGLVWCSDYDPFLFNTIKLVLNYKTNEYVRIMYDYQEIDMTGIPLEVGGGPVIPHMELRYDAVGDTSNNRTAYVDDVILTTMEPK